MVSNLVNTVLHPKGLVNQPVEPTEDEKKFLHYFGEILGYIQENLEGKCPEKNLESMVLGRPYFRESDYNAFRESAIKLGLIIYDLGIAYLTQHARELIK